MNVNWHLSLEDSILVMAAVNNYRPLASPRSQDRYDYLHRQLNALVRRAESERDDVADKLAPEFAHNCGNCYFLGRHLQWSTDTGLVNPEHYDLYVCRRQITEKLEHVELLARYGDEGPEYYCTLFNPATYKGTINSSLMPLAVAYARYCKLLETCEWPPVRKVQKIFHVTCPFCDQTMTRTQFLSHRIHGAFDPATLVDELEGTVKGCASHMERSHLP